MKLSLKTRNYTWNHGNSWVKYCELIIKKIDIYSKLMKIIENSKNHKLWNSKIFWDTDKIPTYLEEKLWLCSRNEYLKLETLVNIWEKTWQRINLIRGKLRGNNMSKRHSMRIKIVDLDIDGSLLRLPSMDCTSFQGPWGSPWKQRRFGLLKVVFDRGLYVQVPVKERFLCYEGLVDGPVHRPWKLS